jgi:putative membrane protein
MMMGDGWMWDHGWSWAGWLVMCVAMLLFWIGLIVATVVAIRYLDASREPHLAGRTGPAPEDLLAQRYARGDIDDDEYRRRLATLREHRVTS